MSILMTFRIALKALGRNKMRTALTMLGMIIGVARGHHDGGARQRRAARRSKRRSSRPAPTSSWSSPATSRRAASARARAPRPRSTPDDAAAIRAGAGRPVRRGRRQHARPGRRRQPELEHADPGHRRRPAADPLVADRVGRFFTPQDVATAGEGRRARHRRPRSAVRRRTTTRSAQIIRISNQPFKVIGVLTSKGQSRHGPGPGRRRLRAVHDGAEEAARHHVHPERSPCRRRRRPTSTPTADAHRGAAARAPQDPAGRPRRLHGADARGDGERPRARRRRR